MFQAIKDWYNLYTPGQFIYHKCFHIVAGFAASGVVSLLTRHVGAGIATACVLGILKEVYDHSVSGANDAPTSAHVFDVIVTTLGGCLVLFISHTL